MSEITVEAFLDYIKQAKSKNTLREYMHGIEAFSKWFDKTPNEILELRRQDWVSGDLHQKKGFMREVEKFHKSLLEKGYTVNSARTMCLGIIQLFRFYEMPITQQAREVSQSVPTTKDYVPSVREYKAMYRVADNLRAKLIISMGKDLAWRIGDFVKIRKDQVPDLTQEPPIPLDLITEKENVLAKSFLSQETVDLLKEYLPTVQNNPNPYLFPSNSSGFYDPESVNRTLRELGERANVKIPKYKRLRFHAFRKRFLSEAANLHIDVNTAKILCGKNVESDMLTYLNEVEHREAFLKIHQRLRLTEPPAPTRIAETETIEISELRKRVDEHERLIHAVIALGGQDLINRAKDMLGLDTMRMTSTQLLNALKEFGAREWKKQRDEYARLITENNNNAEH